MTIRSFYEGGMILFNIELAYRYEEWLAGMLAYRNKAWWERDFRLRQFMYDEFDVRDWPAEAFHVLPGDPLVPMPDVPRILLLKSRHLHRLRLQAAKKIRRTWGRWADAS